MEEKIIMDNIDEVLESLGKYGRWQMMHLLLVGFCTSFATAFSSLGIVFQGWTPPHHCAVDGKNFTLNQTIPFVIDANSGASSMDKCNMYEYPGQTNRNTTVPCQNGYTYDSDGYYTIIEEFSWVCDKAIMNSMAQTVYYSGVLFGSFCFSPFADYFGRKYTSIVTGVVAAMSHLIGGIVVNPVVFIITRFFTGTATMGLRRIDPLARGQLTTRRGESNS
ncbi:solute carrier family 22 member 6-B-like [Tubulanus polymorphus]|uniref:solute carrier family 22 member 6-B-like n=1 Tax=Tubulanus polymorphus TaxID=672921 RepID=UPI003DA6409A